MAHTHYKGTGKIHSFRGLLADGEQDKISIQGSVGAVAYRISKFQVVGATPGAANYESVVQIWREEQAAAVATIDFTNTELLGVGVWSSDSDSYKYSDNMIIIFDNTLFSRNIYLTLQCLQNNSVNYYIELEEVKVSAAGMAQLSLAASRRMQSDV